MGTADWTGQTVARTSGWTLRRIVCESDAASLPITFDKLEAQLSDLSNALKHDQTTTVTTLSHSDKRYVIKRYNARSYWHWFNRLFRRSRASRCWMMSYEFKHAGLNVARPVMMLERRFGPLRRRAYFVSELLDGKVLLRQLPSMGREQQVVVADAVAAAFALMRSELISHGDLKASNLIWLDNQLHFIDLDAAQRHKRFGRWKKSHRKDLRRFMKNWVDQPELYALFEARLPAEKVW